MLEDAHARVVSEL
jgi:hypothetical protein